MALDGVVEKMSANSLWTPADVNGCKRVLGLFRELETRRTHGFFAGPFWGPGRFWVPLGEKTRWEDTYTCIYHMYTAVGML